MPATYQRVIFKKNMATQFLWGRWWMVDHKAFFCQVSGRLELYVDGARLGACMWWEGTVWLR